MTEHGSGPGPGSPRPARPGLDRRTAEQLLRRDPAVHGQAPQLAALLEAAAAPGNPRELAGRSAAVAAFRDVRRPGPAFPGHRRRSARSRLARLLTLKAAVGLALATGGVALAAATGALPGTPQLAEPLPGTNAPAVTSSPTDDKNRTPRSTQPAAAPASSETTCPPGGTGGETAKPPAGWPTGRPAPPPPGAPEIKSAVCVRVSPSVSLSPSALPSFPPQGGQPPAGGAVPGGGSGDCREACPPPGGDDREHPEYPPPPMPPG
jgi:hypothetical protein